MSVLTIDRIVLGAAAADKQEAIQQAGNILVKTGCVRPAYVDGMLARETTMSTYLGEGVSIPHGQYENYGDILQSGISVIQFPDGVEWEDGEKAHLVIGIAASSDEHVGVLSQLAEVIEDEAILDELIHTDDPQRILDCLGTVTT